MVFGKRERAIQCILVVEDEPLVAFDNEHLLKDAGYEVVATVDTAEDAVRVIAEAERIDLVLADLSLSGEGDGVQVAEAAHAKGIAVLFVTGNCPLEARHLAVGCLAKPYSDRVLKSAIDAIDAMLRGERVKKTPREFTIFAKDAA